MQLTEDLEVGYA